MNNIENNLHHVGANKSLIEALVKYKAEFILVGGLAVSWYCSTRQANDMDILVNSTHENSEKVANALLSLNLTGYDSSSFSKPGIQAPIKKHYYADIITVSKKGPTYNELAAESVSGNLFNIPIRIASPVMLIQMKEQAAESAANELKKHQSDIECLKNIVL